MRKNFAEHLECIRDVENNIGCEIPSDYVEFLLFSAGMELFNYDNIDGLELLGVQGIQKYTLYSKNTFEEDWINNIIIFGKIIGEDNYLGFKIELEGYSIIDCYFEQLPIEWTTIGDSFDDFILDYITSLGNKFWIS